jgi:hypothetical protein
VAVKMLSGKDRFKVKWVTMPVDNGWVVTVLTVFGSELTSFWVSDDEMDELIEVLKNRSEG